MKDEQHNRVSLNIQWSYVLCGSTSSFQSWNVYVASPNTKCPNTVYTIILSVKLLSKNASYKLELHNLHLSKTYNLKNMSWFCMILLAFLSTLITWIQQKSHGFCFGTPHVSRGTITGQDSHPSKESIRVWSTSKEGLCHKCLVRQKTRGKHTTLWTTGLSVGLFFFRLKKMPKQNKEWYV